MEETIDLKDLFKILKKRAVLIITIAFIATVCSGVVSYFFMTPNYSVSTQLVVNSYSRDEQGSSPDIQRSLQLINTYSDILTSPAILDIVIEELGINRTASQLKGQMSMDNSNNSQIITLTVQGSDPVLARDIANTTASVFQREIGDILNVDNVSILARAEVPGGPVSPRPTLNMAFALALGLMVGVALAFLLEYLDKTVKTEQCLEKALGLPVLGSVPAMTAEDMKGQRAGRS